MYIIIGDVHQFIGRFIIPLDPWIKPRTSGPCLKNDHEHILNYKKSVVKRSLNVLCKKAAFKIDYCFCLNFININYCVFKYYIGVSPSVAG